MPSLRASIHLMCGLVETTPCARYCWTARSHIFAMSAWLENARVPCSDISRAGTSKALAIPAGLPALVISPRRWSRPRTWSWVMPLACALSADAFSGMAVSDSTSRPKMKCEQRPLREQAHACLERARFPAQVACLATFGGAAFVLGLLPREHRRSAKL